MGTFFVVGSGIDAIFSRIVEFFGADDVSLVTADEVLPRRIVIRTKIYTHQAVHELVREYGGDSCAVLKPYQRLIPLV